jgi:hypothetical protein
MVPLKEVHCKQPYLQDVPQFEPQLELDCHTPVKVFWAVDE